MTILIGTDTIISDGIKDCDHDVWVVDPINYLSDDNVILECYACGKQRSKTDMESEIDRTGKLVNVLVGFADRIEQEVILHLSWLDMDKEELKKEAVSMNLDPEKMIEDATKIQSAVNATPTLRLAAKRKKAESASIYRQNNPFRQ